MIRKPPSDYETYREIMDDLLEPIRTDGLDLDTLKRLYESKLVYLENLRVKCFRDINRETSSSQFTADDYVLILKAIATSKKYLRETLIHSINERLKKSRIA